jgi:hypothetical protein
MQDAGTGPIPSRSSRLPVFGAGPGLHHVPRYRPESIASYYDAAHNDRAIAARPSSSRGREGLLVTLPAALAAQWTRRDPLMRGMSFACIMGVTAILIHSWVDFNLQIPANATLFMTLLALGWISLHLDRQHLNGLRVRTDDDTGP